MSLLKKLSYFGYERHKSVLLYRFHIVVIVINLLAVGIDVFSKRYINTVFEIFVIITLLLNLWYLKRSDNLERVAYLFLSVLTIGLFAIIHLNHFATMSVLFVLLLPLTTMLFMRLKISFLFEIGMLVIMASLLYVEYLQNPSNPLVQNAQALFNLAYTAVIIYAFGLLYHFYILKTFEELDDANRQQKMLLSEVHHRVKNNLNIIASIIGLQSRRSEGKEKEELRKIKVRIESIAIVHEMLYAFEDFEKIDFRMYVSRLSSLILSMYGQKETINVSIDSEAISLPLEKMIHIGIITSELLTNSIKYAFEEDKGEISISLCRENERLLYRYADNGKGVEDIEALSDGKSLGVKLVHLSVKQLKGTLDIQHDNGLHYKVRF